MHILEQVQLDNSTFELLRTNWNDQHHLLHHKKIQYKAFEEEDTESKSREKEEEQVLNSSDKESNYSKSMASTSLSCDPKNEPTLFIRIEWSFLCTF